MSGVEAFVTLFERYTVSDCRMCVVLAWIRFQDSLCQISTAQSDNGGVVFSRGIGLALSAYFTNIPYLFIYRRGYGG